METATTSQVQTRQRIGLGPFIGWIEPISVIAALCVSAAVYFMGTAIAGALLLIFLFTLLLSGSKRFWQGTVSLYIFLCIGLFAAHRFDVDKAPDWLLSMIVPTLIAALLLRESERIGKWTAPIRKVVDRWLRLARLHPIPCAMLFTCIVALLAGAAYLGWLGLLIITLMIGMTQSAASHWKMCAWLMMGLYTPMLHLFIWQGIIDMGTEPLTYIQVYADRIVYPVLVLIYVSLGKTASPKMSARQESAEV
ncbi:hypothetical protein [Marinicrinis lubricantis]|uniref:Uncharacterized protein n=1 Tax=Marinicrinis lubricantis TaxID=2086470 RepID=A0ABW1IKS9_9BACL